MFHTYKDLKLALFPCLLIFFQAQNLLLLSPWLCLILLNQPLFHVQFEHIVVFCIYSSCPVLSRCICQANCTFFFLVRPFCGPMVRVLVTLMLPGKFFLLILSYLAAKVVLLDKVIFNGTARDLSTVFCLFVSSFYH